MALKPRLSIRYITCTTPAQSQQYKIIFICARHKLIVLLISSWTIKQSSYNTSIQFVYDL